MLTTCLPALPMPMAQWHSNHKNDHMEENRLFVDKGGLTTPWTDAEVLNTLRRDNRPACDDGLALAFRKRVTPLAV